MPRLSIVTLGPLEMTSGGRTVRAFKYDKVRALLIYLAVEQARPHERAALLGLLWPDLPEDAARNNLRQSLLTLREAIGDRTAQPPFLLISRPTLQFNPASDHWLDVAEFTALLASCARHVHTNPVSCKACAERRQAAVALYQGDFLAEFFLPDSERFEEWSLLKREWLHRQMSEALAQLVSYHERRGRYAEALAYATRQLNLDPWREEMHRQLMRLHLLTGARGAALAQYEQCRRVLQQEFDAEPEAETTALFAQIRDASDLTPLPWAQLTLPSDARHNLPAAPTAFVGRETELAEIGRLLGSERCRLLTLMGPGGSGKTRLALQAAAELVEHFADGVFFVPLAGMNEVGSLAVTVVDALQVELSSTGDAMAALQGWLRNRDVLLILDNFEHLLAGVTLLADLLQQAPNLVLLVTSRVRLNLQAEWLWPVRGMVLPTQPARDDDADLDAVVQNESMELFLQSAQRVEPHFALSRENVAAAVDICHAVAGLPLALELAASWVRLLTCAEIAAEIQRSLHFLTTTLCDLPSRHRSLAAVFASTWSLLTQEEQAVMAALSLFQGGFRRAAAEEVAGATLPMLGALVDKSLVQRDPGGRYALHELVRQYAYERLAAHPRAPTIRQHYAGCYLALAEIAEPHLIEAGQEVWLARLAEEHDNLRAVLRQLLNDADAEQAARLASALLRFWDRHNHHVEGCRWYAEILATPRAHELSAPVMLKVLFAAGSLARRRDDLPLADRWLNECLNLSRQVSDRAWQAVVLNSLGLLARRQGEVEEAVCLYEESLALGRSLGEQRIVVNALGNLGSIAMLQGDYARAHAYHTEGLIFSREQGDLHGIAADLHNLGQVAFRRAAYGEAASLQEECLAIYRQLGDQRGVLLALEELGLIAFQTEDLARARNYFLEGVALAEAVDDSVSAVQFLERLAWTALAQGKPASAVQIWGAAAQQRMRLNTPLVLNELADQEEMIVKARAQLTPAQFAQAWAAGAIQSLQQAVALARQHG